MEANSKGSRQWQNFVNVWNCYDEPQQETKILDLGCGAGSAVFNGRKDGYPCFGVDSGQNRMDQINEKVKLFSETGVLSVERPPFVKAVAEKLPFKNESLNAIFTYYALEHVLDIKAVINECLRAIKPGGMLYIVAPDYIGFYEGHYQIFWLPLFPRKLAKVYLWLRRLDTKMIDRIKYTTGFLLVRLLKEHDVQVYDQRMLFFHTNFNRDIGNPDKISTQLKRTVYKSAKLLKLTKHLKFIEEIKFRLTNRFVSLTVIKNPNGFNAPAMQKIRVH